MLEGYIWPYGVVRKKSFRITYRLSEMKVSIILGNWDFITSSYIVKTNQKLRDPYFRSPLSCRTVLPEMLPK